MQGFLETRKDIISKLNLKLSKAGIKVEHLSQSTKDVVNRALCATGEYDHSIGPIGRIIQKESPDSYYALDYLAVTNMRVRLLQTSCLDLYNEIARQYPNKEDASLAQSKASAILHDVFEEHLKNTHIALAASDAKAGLPIYDQTYNRLKESWNKFSEPMSVGFAKYSAHMVCAINDVPDSKAGQKSDPVLREFEHYLKKTFATCAHNDLIVKVERCLKDVIKNKEALSIMSDVVEKAVDERIRIDAEHTKKARFNPDGPLATYLKSADAKILAKELDRNMRGNHVTLDNESPAYDTIGEKDAAPYSTVAVRQFYPKEVVEKMEQVGMEVTKRQKERSTFVGAVVQKIGDYANVTLNVFSKLFGKKVDNPALKAAINECAKKRAEISKHPARKNKKVDDLGKFTSQVLQSRLHNVGAAHRS